jgi:FkbM family methyltransferase
MSNYWDERFTRHLNKKIEIIVEAGARYGEESIAMASIFKDAKLFSFECNPNTVEICKNKLKDVSNISFIPIGLGDKNEQLPFYSYIENNDGASSFLKRIDAERTQVQTGTIDIIKLSDFVSDHNISTIDLLCMDVQGYELNILKGCGDFIKNIKFVIMEEPKPIINTKYLPVNVHSKYINSPTSQEINAFMTEHNFVEIERIKENEIEDNVMYMNNNA